MKFAPDGGTIGGLKTAFTDISAETQFFDHVKINSISQLINGISKRLQKLLEYFKGTTTSPSVNESLFGWCFSYNICFVFERFRISRNWIT